MKYAPYQQRHGSAPEDFVPEYTPTYRLEQFIAEARKEMGEDRWNELQAEWTQAEGTQR